MTDQRNLILAIVLSIVIVLGFEFAYNFLSPPPPPRTDTSQAVAPGNTLRADGPRAPGAEASSPAAAPVSRDEIIAGDPRVQIATPQLRGSISLTGARFDDLTLINYRETVEPDSPEIVLLSPKGTAISGAEHGQSMFMPRSEVTNSGPYYAWLGWLPPEESGIAVPDETTVWQADRQDLTPDRPVTLRWDNGQGLRFIQRVQVDETFMFTIDRSVENYGTTEVALSPFGIIARTGTPWISGFYILHEGPLGVFDGTLEEYDYSDLQDDGRIEATTTGGWIGITDKYWLVTLIPDQRERFRGSFAHWVSGSLDKFQTDYLREELVIPAGGSVEVTDRVFAGAKVAETLADYQDTLGIVRFDLAAAFRWLYFLAEPLFHVLMFFNNILGNFGLAILLLTVCVKIVFFPLANKAYRSMASMKKLQPEVTKMREQFSGDRARMQKEMMALYKREKANPMMGCLPMLIQIPVFFALYQVLFVTIEMRQAPFFGWVTDLSARDPSNVFNPFGLIPFEYPDILQMGILPILMGLSMWLQMRLNPQPQDPIQAKIFLFMPIFFTFLLASFPAGLVIYWTWNNLLSILQQWVIMKRMGIARPASS